MHHDRFQRYLPLSGVLGGLALGVGILLTGGEPGGDDPAAATIVSWYSAHSTAVQLAGTICAPLFAVCLLAFAAGLRATLRSGEAGESTYSAIVAGAAPLVAIAILIMSTLDLAISRAAEHGDGEAARTLFVAGSYAWLPWAAPTGALLLATGIGGLRTTTLPRALSWLSLLLGVAALTPVGAVVFLVLPLWLIACGAVLQLRRPAAAGVAGVARPAVS